MKKILGSTRCSFPGQGVGAWVGARVVGGLAPVLHQRLFALFLLVIAARLWFTAGR